MSQFLKTILIQQLTINNNQTRILSRIHFCNKISAINNNLTLFLMDQFSLHLRDQLSQTFQAFHSLKERKMLTKLHT
jgi:hypothetical protein